FGDGIGTSSFGTYPRVREPRNPNLEFGTSVMTHGEHCDPPRRESGRLALPKVLPVNPAPATTSWGFFDRSRRRDPDRVSCTNLHLRTISVALKTGLRHLA